ncbi:MAG: transporter substrate-binding domain-containing protein [Candidatus Devosia phytovorans]|uniref:Transporter substrate-binding domain-containing protein n=1 Tax=Candidatus Devosia phytovorans TaxID=3121372 RepID=A0AAJ5VS47_9HYPH|nr:transporter substrate-binding domain-containing protein [Devosia sp.]WEK03237.1 MAG: transporter substrate-binding domain-containing protein [Devosia sp.]
MAKLKMLAMIFGISIGMCSIAMSQPLRIATEGAYPPFNFVDEKGELAGFDVDIAKALCVDMDRQCTFVAVPWADIIGGLQASNYDVIVASMAYSDERAELVDFTEPYYRSYSAFVADPSKFADTTPKALRGKRIATNEGTIQAEFLTKYYPESEILLTIDQPAAYKLLASGAADLMMGDAIEQLSFLESAEGAAFSYIGDPVTGDYVQTSARIAVHKGDSALLEAINGSLKNIKLDGTYDRLNAAYFPFSID